MEKPYYKKRFEKRSKELLDANLGLITKKFETIPLSMIGQFQYIMQQIISEEMGSALRSAFDDPKDPGKKAYVNLSAFEDVDVLKQDRALGICGLPLFDFTQSDIEFILSSNLDDLKQLLIDKDIYQFFFPSADTAILGLIERRMAAKNISEQVSLLPQLGHPFGQAEIVKGPKDIPHIVEELQSMNLVVEGEMSLTLSEKGESIRAKIKFKPREGVLSKLANRLRLNIGVHFSDHN